MDRPLRYALIGCGSFGRFCLEQYRSLPEVEIARVADLDPDLAERTGEAQGVPYGSPEEALADPDVDLVHLATPPFTHLDLTLAALEAGKHVLCEKPLATEIADGEAMVRLAQERGRLLAVNLIMRYNPLLQSVKAALESGILGRPIHAAFENLAKDSSLGPDHWFWNSERSGGIFVEHGVHFFDLFEWWFGPGRVLGAAGGKRPGTEIVEQVAATVRYADGLATFYHGFHQDERLDRQELTLVAERGEIRLHEWVPTRAEVTLYGRIEDADRLAALFPKVAQRSRSGRAGEARGRFQTWPVDGLHRLTATAGLDKPALYGHVVRELLRDQVAWIRDRRHVRRTDAGNALRSLEMAVQARAMAVVE